MNKCSAYVGLDVHKDTIASNSRQRGSSILMAGGNRGRGRTRDREAGASLAASRDVSQRLPVP